MCVCVQALDILTPLGRGASLLVIGPHSSGLSSLAVDAILAQRSSGVKCVIAMTSATAQQLQKVGVMMMMMVALVIGCDDWKASISQSAAEYDEEVSQFWMCEFKRQ